MAHLRASTSGPVILLYTFVGYPQLVSKVLILIQHLQVITRMYPKIRDVLQTIIALMTSIGKAEVLVIRFL